MQTLPEALSQITIARGAIPQFTELLELAGNLTGWFLDLSDDELRVQQDDGRTPETAQNILTELRKPLDSFASVFDKQIQWIIPADRVLKLPGDTVVARLINAAIFQYLDTVFKLRGEAGVAVEVQRREGNAVFSVRCGGDLIAQGVDGLPFTLNIVAGTKQSARQPAARIKQGLYRVSQIAQRLDGHAFYRPEPQFPLPNCFYLVVPLLS